MFLFPVRAAWSLTPVRVPISGEDRTWSHTLVIFHVPVSGEYRTWSLTPVRVPVRGEGRTWLLHFVRVHVPGKGHMVAHMVVFQSPVRTAHGRTL